MSELQSAHPNEIAVVWRHYPLPGHVGANAAAQGAICASRQNRFSAYHLLLFRASHPLSSESLEQIAVSADVPDLLAFRSCMSSGIPDSIIERDLTAADDLGVVVTPTFLVDSAMFKGAKRDLRRIVGSRLKRN